MFTKDECLLALKGLRALERAENFKKWNGQVAPQIKCDVMERLINEHFDEKGNVKAFAKIVFDEDKMKELVNEAIEEIINPQPYEFEDLKDGYIVVMCNKFYCDGKFGNEYILEKEVKE